MARLRKSLAGCASVRFRCMEVRNDALEGGGRYRGGFGRSRNGNFSRHSTRSRTTDRPPCGRRRCQYKWNHRRGVSNSERNRASRVHQWHRAVCRRRRRTRSTTGNRKRWTRTWLQLDKLRFLSLATRGLRLKPRSEQPTSSSTESTDRSRHSDGSDQRHPIVHHSQRACERSTVCSKFGRNARWRRSQFV